MHIPGVFVQCSFISPQASSTTSCPLNLPGQGPLPGGEDSAPGEARSQSGGHMTRLGGSGPDESRRVTSVQGCSFFSYLVTGHRTQLATCTQGPGGHTITPAMG